MTTLTHDRSVSSNTADGSAIHIASAGHVAFAVTMIVMGVMGFMASDFSQMWQAVPAWVPARTALAYVWAALSLAGGVGLLWRRSAPLASRVLLATLLLWLLVLRLPNLFYQTPLVLVGWTFGSTAVMAAGAWVLFTWFANERDRARLGFFTDARGLRVARVLYGVSLIPFGLAHFLYLKETTVLIPTWLPWTAAWAYFTGAAFIAAGLAVCFGVLPRLAATLSTLQMALFGLIVWVPRVLAGTVNEFQRGEFIQTFVLTAGAWVVADSYRGTPWLAGSKKEIGV